VCVLKQLKQLVKLKLMLTMFCPTSSAVADRVPEGAITVAVAGCSSHVTQDKLAARVHDAVHLISAVGALTVHKDGISATVADQRHCGQKSHGEESEDW